METDNRLNSDFLEIFGVQHTVNPPSHLTTGRKKMELHKRTEGSEDNTAPRHRTIFKLIFFFNLLCFRLPYEISILLRFLVHTICICLHSLVHIAFLCLSFFVIVFFSIFFISPLKIFWLLTLRLSTSADHSLLTQTFLLWWVGGVSAGGPSTCCYHFHMKMLLLLTLLLSFCFRVFLYGAVIFVLLITCMHNLCAEIYIRRYANLFYWLFTAIPIIHKIIFSVDFLWTYKFMHPDAEMCKNSMLWKQLSKVVFKKF